MQKRRVFQYNENKELVAIFPTLSAAEAEGFYKNAIGRVAMWRSKNFGQMYKGYYWRYRPLEKDRGIAATYAKCDKKVEINNKKILEVITVRLISNSKSHFGRTFFYINETGITLNKGDMVICGDDTAQHTGKVIEVQHVEEDQPLNYKKFKVNAAINIKKRIIGLAK